MSWPEVRFTTRVWSPATTLHDAVRSPRRHQANGASYRQAVVPMIATKAVSVPATVFEDVDEATNALTRFDTHDQNRALCEAVLLRSESAASSAIEGFTARTRHIVLAELGDRSRASATLIAGNTLALSTALRLAHSPTEQTILAIHGALVADSDPSAGMFRTEQNWISGDSPVTAQFVPPSHAKIPHAMKDLVQFMQRREIPALVQAAIAHAQFETIHPFSDGNGRTGRALVSAILRARGTTVNFTIPLSSGLLTRTREYFEALDAYREGNLEPIITEFVDAAHRAMTNAQVLMLDIEQLREKILNTATRRTKNLHLLTELCTTEPAFTAHMVQDKGIPPSSSYKILGKFETTGILKVEQKVRGQRVWSVPNLTTALDNFARRVGRRTWAL